VKPEVLERAKTTLNTNRVNATGVTKAETAETPTNKTLEILGLRNKHKLELDAKAAAAAKRWMLFGFGYLIIQFGILARMVWIDFNWDIMEPVTYFVGLTTLMGGYIFFVLYDQEYTYAALEERQFKKSLRKLYIKEEFHWKRWNELHQEVELLKVLLGPKNIPEEAKTLLQTGDTLNVEK